MSHVAPTAPPFRPLTQQSQTLLIVFSESRRLPGILSHLKLPKNDLRHVPLETSYGSARGSLFEHANSTQCWETSSVGGGESVKYEDDEAGVPKRVRRRVRGR